MVSFNQLATFTGQALAFVSNNFLYTIALFMLHHLLKNHMVDMKKVFALLLFSLVFLCAHLLHGVDEI